MNNITVIGRLTRDAEEKGESIKFDVASDVGYGDKKITNFFGCWMTKSRGEKLKQYLTKGKMVAVAGEFKANEYQSKDGATKTGLNISVNSFMFCDSKREELPTRYNNENRAPVASTANASEDLPF